MDVSGQTAVVTGGASGLGEATGRDGEPSSLEKLARAVRVNLIGTINSCRLAAADMAALEPVADNERGCIATNASVAAFEGQVG